MSDPRHIPPLVTLRTLREIVGLSSPQLADRIAQHGLDIHPDSILNVELGRKGASKPLLAAWAQAYGVKPCDIWTSRDVYAKVLRLLKDEQQNAERVA